MRLLQRRHPARKRIKSVVHTIDDARGKKSVTAAVLTAAGAVGLTAASARISSLRRRSAADDDA